MFGLSEKIYQDIMKIVNHYQQYKFKIFGSRARGDYKNNSDIDLAVFVDVPKEVEYQIRDEIDLLNIAYQVDIVFVDSHTKKELLENIEKEGVELKNEKTGRKSK